MVKNSKQRTEVKALPKKSKKLSSGDMKKVKGGATDFLLLIEGVKGESSDRNHSRK